MINAAASVTAVAVGVIITGFVVASFAEVALWRKADLGVIYITIIGAETFMILGWCWPSRR